MKPISKTWADYTESFKFEDIDETSLHTAKRFIYDSMGCALGAHLKPDVKIAEKVYGALAGAAQASLIASGTKLPVTSAAFVNGLKIRAMDYNDIYWKADPTHPSDLISGPMATAEWMGKSGRDFLAAVVLAYELEMRMAEFAEPGIRERGWHHATLTAFVSPLAAGYLMDMNSDQLMNAVGISGSHGCTLGKVVAGKLSNMKNTAEPFAVADGVIAALLAKEGYSGPEEVFEGKEGLFHCLGEAWNPSILTEGLGSELLRINRCSMKAFPTEALTHTPIGAFLSIVRENNISHDRIESVLVKSIERAADILSDPAKYRPESKETADHSLPYCLAVGAVDHAVTPDSFNEERLEDERIFSVIDKFKVIADPEFERIFPEKQATHVTVNTTDGESYELRMDYPKGDPREPMSEEELDIKFRALVGKVMTDKRMDEVKSAIFELDSFDNFGEFMKVLKSDK